MSIEQTSQHHPADWVKTIESLKGHPAGKIIEWYENLTPETLPQIREIYASSVRFQDPFVALNGVTEVQHYLGNMFTKFAEAKFTFHDLLSEENRICLFWKFRCRKFGLECEVSGMFLLHLNKESLVTRHQDYWDSASQIYEKLPVIGCFFRLWRRFFRTFL